MESLGQAVPAEDPQAEECRLDEEGEQTLHGQRGPEYVTDEAGVLAPRHAELELLHDAGRDTHDEVDQVELAPELGHSEVLLVAGAHPERLHNHDGRAETQSERNEQEVVNGGDAELPTGDVDGIQGRAFLEGFFCDVRYSGFSVFS